MALDKQIIWKAPFKRDDAFPLDRSLVFTSYDDMLSYASSTAESPHAQGVPYAGQIVSVVNDSNKTAKIYCIEEVGETAKIKSMESQYTDGNGIDINAENQITVKVADSNITGVENFINTDANGISVTGVTSNKTLTSEAITIEGGPLATENVKKAFEGGVIPVGTDIQALLKALFCEEKYPQLTSGSPLYTTQITPPTISGPKTSGSLVEVGESISINRVKATPVSFDKTQIYVKGFMHGYSDTINGDAISSTEITTSWDPEQKSNTFYTLTPSIYTGFTGDLPISASSVSASTCELENCTLIAGLGENTYKVKETAPTFVGSHTGITSKYIISNLGGRDEAHKSPEISGSATDREQTPTDKTGSYTVIGVYPVYSNIKNGKFISGATEGFALQTGVTFVISSVPTEAGSLYNFMFDYPATKSISSFETKDVEGNWTPFSAWYDAKSEEVTKTINGKSYKYYRLTTGGDNGDSKGYKITLNESLNK